MLGVVNDVVDEGPMTICETVVAGIITVDTDGTIAVGVLWDVAGLVLIVRDGTPGTVAHAVANARNGNA